LILSVVQKNISGMMFWRLSGDTVVMLWAGYSGEAGFIGAWQGFIAGEAGVVAASGDKVSEYVKQSFQTMRLIVTVGWSIYPLGYFFGYLMGGLEDSILNLVYNLADFVNKIAFCLAIWNSARQSTLAKGEPLLGR